MMRLAGKNKSGCVVPGVSEEIYEKAKFLGAASIILWVPTLLYCAVIGIVPFYFLMVTQSLGICLGVWLYHRRPPDFEGGYLMG